MKLAIIGPAFFGYLKDLATGFETIGTSVRYFDERPSNSVSSKVFYRLARQDLKDKASAAHIDTVVRDIINGGYSHVLLVSFEIVTKAAVEKLKAAGLTVCRYGWDSVSNKPLMYSLDPLMDRIASFDMEDCATEGYEYIPLYSNLVPDPSITTKDSDFFYCTTLHSNRPLWVKRFLDVITAKSWIADFKLFYHNTLLWRIRYANQPEVWHLAKQISTKPFSRTEIAQATQRARVVLDIHHGAQTGLTMRTYETLALGSVLLTTNAAAFKALPADLLARVVLLDEHDLETSMQTALDQNPPALTDAQIYSLSQARFITQLIALLTGEPVPAAHPKI